MGKVLREGHKRLCSECKGEAKYSGLIIDAFFCESCDIWLEQKCSHIGCVHCFKRGDKPSQSKFERIGI